MTEWKNVKISPRIRFYWDPPEWDVTVIHIAVINDSDGPFQSDRGVAFATARMTPVNSSVSPK